MTPMISACAKIDPTALRVLATLYCPQESLNVNAPGGKSTGATTLVRTGRNGAGMITRGSADGFSSTLARCKAK
jgi:hypothetical protein